MARTSNHAAPEFISKGVEFVGSNFSGRNDKRFYTLGELPRSLYRFAREHESGGIDYAVYSYHTPIAWRKVSGEWVFPEVRYSITTSRHQYITRMALLEFNPVQPGGLKWDW